VAWAADGAVRAGLIAVVVHASAEVTEAVLAEGFDDVVRAPVSTRELVARVRAVHRRVFWKGSANGRLRFAELTLDLYGRELWVAGTTVVLTSVELAVLRELMKARGRPLARAELLDLAWGEGELEVSERAVDNVILRLRRKLPRPELLETVRGVGFRLAPMRAP
jgi:DNA-binding response OmpR family regulator